MANGLTKVGASEEEITALEAILDTALPNDYLDFLRGNNGIVEAGPASFAILDPAKEVFATTCGYNPSDEFAPGLVVIGSDGCGNLLGIDTRSRDPADMDYVLFDSCNIAWQEERLRVNSLGQLLKHLEQTQSRLGRECAKLDPQEEQALADEELNEVLGV